MQWQDHRTRHRLRRARLLAFSLGFSVALSGCVTRRIVWSECPAPNPDEAQDVSLILVEDGDRPAAHWIARVIGHIYSDELREVRGEPDPD